MANKTHKIAIIPGDGTGPEVVREAVKVLDAVAQKDGFKLDSTSFDFGGERYLKTKVILTEDELRGLTKFDAILLGAVGHPDVKPGILERELPPQDPF